MDPAGLANRNGDERPEGPHPYNNQMGPMGQSKLGVLFQMTRGAGEQCSFERGTALCVVSEVWLVQPCCHAVFIRLCNYWFMMWFMKFKSMFVSIINV